MPGTPFLRHCIGTKEYSLWINNFYDVIKFFSSVGRSQLSGFALLPFLCQIDRAPCLMYCFLSLAALSAAKPSTGEKTAASEASTVGATETFTIYDAKAEEDG